MPLRSVKCNMEPAVSPQPQYSGATTTANSEKEGRLKVDAGGMSAGDKKTVLKKILIKVKSVKMKMK